jgi:sulfur carrier protein
MLAGMEITVNGRPEQIDGRATVADVVRRSCRSADGVAVARNGDVVPRSAWARTALDAGDRLEILTAAAGG